MNMLGTHHAMIMVKTLTGAWCTSDRFHEGTRRTCLFGCLDDMDDLKHYLFCPKMWSELVLTTDTTFLVRPLARLGLLPPSLGHMMNILVAFSTYHDLKLSKVELLTSSTPAVRRTMIKEAVALALRTSRWAARPAAIADMHAISYSNSHSINIDNDIFSFLNTQ